MVQTELENAKLLSLTGRLDAEAAPDLEQRCRQLIERDTQTLIVNVGTLDYLSSAGLRTLLGAGKSLQNKGGKLIVVAAEGPVRQIIELAGFGKVFAICGTLEEAGRYSGPKFGISHSTNSGAEVLTISGRVDAERAPEVEEAGRRILSKDYLKLILDMTGLQYLSSAGLCSLLNLVKLAKTRHCRLIVCGPNAAVRQILKLSGFDKLFPVMEDLTEALVA